MRLEGVGFEAGGSWILRGATLEIRPGELVCVVGPNGAGKSTLLRLMCGLRAPSEGRVTLGDASLEELERQEVARRIAFVPQRAKLAQDFTVEEIVLMGRYPHEGRWTWWKRAGRWSADRLEHVLEQTDLLGLRHRVTNDLSGGESQRVQLARCLATDAQTIVLDEPTANLDPAHALAVMHLAGELARTGKSVVLALHDLNAAVRFADRVVLMAPGRIVAEGPPDQTLTAERVGEVFSVVVERIEASASRVMVFHRR